ncbi:hypothetical protein P4N68_07295 [Corynebacterium felinum]|uniref:Energy-coupling factor transporter ATP-binding protein EcfA2 n=1 Tax=Corynebacterium felinum TaxID=131318 RepID=A0ABU2B7L8_9CORY|nr:hypothetical protein [Corynebacterium felinum]MDF5820885.1 hypothetical protein [Corynebacterium felinum]MDR7354603.1 energy-coupling factor transporter ATP-binding protein EcfA2 [Corynebacterium felinum]
MEPCALLAQGVVGEGFDDTFFWGRPRILRDCALTFHQQRFTVLVVAGAPGMGKTSVLRAYAGLVDKQGWGMHSLQPATFTDVKLAPHHALTCDDLHRWPKRSITELTAKLQEADTTPATCLITGTPALAQRIAEELTTADFYQLQLLSPSATHTVVEQHAHVDADAKDFITTYTHGYPTLIGLVLEQLAPHATVTLPLAHNACHLAREQLIASVFVPTLQRLSAGDIAMLCTIAADTGPSRIGTIASALHLSPQQATNYRTRLIGAGLLVSPSRGHVAFTLPYLREYLRTLHHDDHTTTQQWF